MHPIKISIRLHINKSKKLTDGSHPIVLTYTINGVRTKKTVHHCQADEWDTKTSRVKVKSKNSAYVNALLAEKYSEAEQTVLLIKQGTKDVSELFASKEKVTLKQGFNLELKRLEKDCKTGFYDKVCALQKQIGVLGDYGLVDIDKIWFEKLVSNLKEVGNNGTTIKKKIKLIRGVIGRYNKHGVTKEIKDFSVPMSKSLKQKLSDSEFYSLENLALPDGDQITEVRDLFLLQIYLRGIRVGDLLQAKSEDFKDGRYIYRSNKTDTELSIKLIPAALLIIEKYAGKNDRLFSFFKWRNDDSLNIFKNKQMRLKHKETCTTVINKHLKVLAVMAGINKPLSSHIARHTFARMAINKINNPMITMELLGHTSLAVHQAYLNDIKKDDELDQAADDIFG